MHSFKVVFICITILIFGMGSLWGAGVVPSDMNSPGEVVQARKALMMAIKINMDDVGKKLKLGQLNDIRANALSIDVMARLIPPLYRETLREAYTGEGNFFKGAPQQKIQSIATKLSGAAQTLGSAAARKDKGAIQAGIGKVYQTCGACHKPYRGKF
jgi:cytochrome c556